MNTPFWDNPETVARFASREPDLRMMSRLSTYPHPRAVRVLDLGCAGGRNTVVLAERGFDFHAIDASPAMVERTRSGVAPFVGEDEARTRVRLGRMDDLREFADGSFHLVLALGVYHNATSAAEFDTALRETSRVTRPQGGGVVLVANFDPATDMAGTGGLTPVPGEPHMYDGFPSGRVCMWGQDDLDAAFASRGLVPVVETQTVKVETERGYRVTVNGMYRSA